jgi:hypothetical protein
MVASIASGKENCAPREANRKTGAHNGGVKDLALSRSLQGVLQPTPSIARKRKGDKRSPRTHLNGLLCPLGCEVHPCTRQSGRSRENCALQAVFADSKSRLAHMYEKHSNRPHPRSPKLPTPAKVCRRSRLPCSSPRCQPCAPITRCVMLCTTCDVACRGPYNSLRFRVQQAFVDALELVKLRSPMDDRRVERVEDPAAREKTTSSSTPMQTRMPLASASNAKLLTTPDSTPPYAANCDDANARSTFRLCLNAQKYHATSRAIRGALGSAELRAHAVLQSQL